MTFAARQTDLTLYRRLLRQVRLIDFLAAGERRKGKGESPPFSLVPCSFLLAPFSLLLVPFLAWAQDERPPLGHTRSLTVPQTAQAPVIDGRLDEEIWKTAAVADRFWVAMQQRWPTEQTEVLVLADAENLYFGFRVDDHHPGAISALQTRRDAKLDQDDHVEVELDPYHNHRQTSSYAVNAQGTQSDAIAGGRARKIEWKGDWKAAVTRTAYGWSAEIAIPFSILNLHDTSQVFGVNFVRYHYRTDEKSRWADLTPQDKPEEMGHLRLTELEPRAVGKKQAWTFMPYVLVGYQVPNKEGKVHDFLGTGGIDFRYEPRQNLTGMFALNPDFSQVEEQVTDIDFNYNEKFRADPRPFFQEGAAYFGGKSERRYFYSNRLPDFDYGGKLFAQLGRYQVGGLVTAAPHSRWDTAFRLTRELNATTSASVMFVGTNRHDVKNQLAVGQFEGRQPSGLNYSLDLALSRTQKRKGDGGLLRALVGWQWDHLSISNIADYYSVNFFPANGLLARDLPGTWGVKSYAEYYRDMAEGPLRTLSGGLAWSGRNTSGGLTQTRNWEGGGSIELRQQVKLGLSYSNGIYRPVGDERGQWSNALHHDHYWTAKLEFNTRSSRWKYGITYSWGSLGGSNYSYLAPEFWIRPTDRTFVKVSTEQLQSFGSSAQTIIAGGWDLTSQDSIVMRYILANGEHFFRFAYSRQVRSGMDIFAVYDKEPDSPAKASVKLVFSFP